MSGCHLTNRNCSGDCDEANQMRIELPKCSGVMFQWPVVHGLKGREEGCKENSIQIDAGAGVV